jgi:hypothetical protein
MIRPLFAVALSALSLAACDSGEPPHGAETDPAIAAALDEPLMTDPELAGDRGAAVGVVDSRIALPPEDRSPEAIASARKVALEQAGGALQALPRAGKGGPGPLGVNLLTAAQVARASGLASAACVASLEYSNGWAARLPPAIAIYPHAAVQEAAGTDSGTCALRVVHFVTPVPRDEVVAYTLTMARKAGFGADFRRDGGDAVLGGKKGGAAYAFYARTRDGLTEADLVVAGRN